MKDRFLSISIIISAVIVCVGLFSVSQAINNSPFAGTPNIPSYIEVSEKQTGDYMSEWEAAAYLRFDDVMFHDLLTSGELDETYSSYESVKQIPDSSEIVTGTLYIFSKSKLDDWMNDRIKSQN